jgi:hypothetical protein
MQEVQTISLRQVALLNFLQRLNKIVALVALAAVAAVVLYVAGYFLYEWLVPPTPAVVNPDAPGALFFGADDGRRAIWLVTPAMRWIGRILYLQSVVHIGVAVTFLSFDRPGAKKLIAGALVGFAAMLFSLAASFSCGC